MTHDGSIVWQRLAGQTIPSILQLKKLMPNESFELLDRWKANVPAGTYHVAGSLLTDAEALTTDSLAVTIE